MPASRHRLAVLLLLAATVSAPLPAGETEPPPLNPAPQTKPLQRFEYTQRQMGMPFVITLYAPDPHLADTAARAAFARIKALNLVLSDYEPDSEAMRLCTTAGTGQAVPVSEDLAAVLDPALSLSEKSAGAFDVTVGPLVRLWRKSKRTKTLPSADDIAEARRRVGYHHLRFDPKRRTVELSQPGMLLDFGGIAAGFAADEALAVLKSHGITQAMIDASGDVAVSDPPPGQPGWRVGIAPLEPDAPPSQTIVLANAAVTTSGDAFQFVEINGRRFSHIVDPATGLGLETRSSVTVIAPTCTAADSYATALSILGPDKGLPLVEKLPDAAALIVRQIDGRVRVDRSRRLDKYLASPP